MSDEKSYGQVLWEVSQKTSFYRWESKSVAIQKEFEMLAKVLIDEYKRRNHSEDEDAWLIDRMSKILAGVAIALKGKEEPLHRHGYQDLVEKAQVMALENEILKSQASEMAQPVAWMWTEYNGIGGSPLTRYGDIPPGHITNAIPLYKAQQPLNLPSADEIEDMIDRHIDRCMADDISVTTSDVANDILKLIKSKQK